jgi:hypothetical protein
MRQKRKKFSIRAGCVETNPRELTGFPRIPVEIGLDLSLTGFGGKPNLP